MTTDNLNMDNEAAIAEMGSYLAQRAYLFGILRIAFGSRPDVDTVHALYSQETARALTLVNELVEKYGEKKVLKNMDVELRDEVLKRLHEGVVTFAENHDKDIEETVAALTSDYNRLFLVPGPSYVHPWESPYTSSNRMLMQESTLDVRNTYHEAGFKLIAEKHFPDDHIATMMDFLSRTSLEAFEAYADNIDCKAKHTINTQREFIENHIMTWMEDFAQKVVEKGENSPWVFFACVLVVFIRLDMLYTAAIVKAL